MDVVLTEGKMAGIDAIRKVRALSDDQLPVLVVSARTDFVAKLKQFGKGQRFHQTDQRCANPENHAG